MIDISSLKSSLPVDKEINSARIHRAHSEVMKGRKILLARYQNIGNPHGYSQIPNTDRGYNLTVAGSIARSESRDRKPYRQRSIEVGDLKATKQDKSDLESPSSLGIKNGKISTQALPKVQNSKEDLNNDPGIKLQDLLIRHNRTIRKTSEQSTQRERKESDSTIFTRSPTSVKRMTRKISEISSISKKDSDIQETFRESTEESEIPQNLTLRKTSSMTYIEKKGLPVIQKSSKPKPSIKAAVGFIMLAKFLKNDKDKKGPLKLPGLKLQKSGSLGGEHNDQKLQIRLLNLMSKDFKEERNMSCRFSNPILPIFEDMNPEDIGRSSDSKHYTPKSLLEYVNDASNWNLLGATTKVETDEKLEYKISFDKSTKKSAQFSHEDYGLLEWRSRTENDTVRKIFHKQSLHIFAFRTISLEKYNNDPSDVKNDLKILSVLTKHPHRNIIRLIASRMGISSEMNSDQGKLTDAELYSELRTSNNLLAMDVAVLSEFGVANLKEVARVKQKQGLKWSENDLLILLKEAVSALAHCEALGITHRNVKPSNIFFGEDNLTMKLIDFKLSLLLENGQKTLITNVVGTPRYMSFEVKKIYNDLRGKRKTQAQISYDPFLSDVCSLGLVILELAIVSQGIDTQIKLEAETAQILLKHIEEAYPYLTKLLKKMMNVEPEKRPRFEELEINIQVPDDSERVEVYEKRHSFLSVLDERKRDAEWIDDVEKSTELLKAYLKCHAEHKGSITNSWESVKGSPRRDKLNGDCFFSKKKAEDLNKQAVILSLNKCCNELKRKGDYEKAIATSRLLQQYYVQDQLVNDARSGVSLYTNMAKANFLLNRCNESMEMYNQALKMAKKYFGETHISIAMVLNNMGSVYYSAGKIDQAKEMFDKSSKLKESLGLKGFVTHALTVHNIGNIHQMNGESQFAMNCYEEAHRSYSGTPEKTLEHTGKLLLAQSVLHYALFSEVEKGEQCLSQAFEVFQKITSDKREEFFGIAYYHLGMFHYCTKEFAFAQEAFLKALVTLENIPVRQNGLINAVKKSLKILEDEMNPDK